MIIDIHAHTSTHQMRGLHTSQAGIEYLRHMAEKFDISKICIMATYFPLKGSGLHNEELLDRIKGDAMFSCFGSLNLEKDIEEGIAEIERLSEDEMIEGIKLYPGYQKIILSDERFWPLYEIAEKFDLLVACHMGELHHCCSKKPPYRCSNDHCPLDDENRKKLSSPIELGKTAKIFPNVKFIASHLGNPFFEDLQNVMSNYQNIYTDISGQFVSGSKEDTPEYRNFIVSKIREFLNLECGIERVMFGTDFPIQSYKDTLELVKALDLKTAQEKMILSGNAKKILKIKGDG
jgi:predicted TIM-barrel fold metal-dependent hydrolase